MALFATAFPEIFYEYLSQKLLKNMIHVNGTQIFANLNFREVWAHKASELRKWEQKKGRRFRARPSSNFLSQAHPYLVQWVLRQLKVNGPWRWLLGKRLDLPCLTFTNVLYNWERGCIIIFYYETMHNKVTIYTQYLQINTM